MQPVAIENANVPAFLGKLWKMVNDPSTNHLIRWSPAGNSFIIPHQYQFWCELLPVYYKHNNMSSFVRQLNMYGFHKISTVDNGSMDSDKDEIQFYHPCFQKGHPEKLKNIKRKVTTTKAQETGNQDELTKVLTEVKQLRGRQTNIDSQLSTMKQENTVLWRELALLRQKHMKQQQIVNKLIQFLVTLVQPATQRMSVGVKRRMPLMLHESPTKKMKPRKSASRHSTDETGGGGGGPTIHELDTEIDINPEEFLEDSVAIDEPLVNSPVPSTASGNSQSPEPTKNTNTSFKPEETSQDALNSNFIWDKPEFVNIEGPNDMLSDNDEDLINSLQNNAASNEKIFLNPNNRDALISNLISSGAYNTAALSGKNMSNDKKSSGKMINTQQNSNLRSDVKNSPIKINSGTLRTNDCFREDLDVHLDHTQSELDQLKDILNGCTSFDANALLGLFSDTEPDFGLPKPQNKDNANTEGTDPMVSGNELATTNGLIDFTELFDDSLSSQDNLPITETDILSPSTQEGLDTPMMIKNEPLFPGST